jgi:thioredoxin-like negative regulator of GroEL
LSGVIEFSAACKGWSRQLELAQRGRRAGDVSALAEEKPSRALALEARRTAGDSLLKQRQPELALEQFGAVLETDPDVLPSRQKRGVCLCRIGQ